MVAKVFESACISIHALHEESDRSSQQFPVKLTISIHALHEESDLNDTLSSQKMRISIHALHEESDEMRQSLRINQYIFQSTLSMRRATRWLTIFHDAQSISIHALHEESDRCNRFKSDKTDISIHALHEESDSAAGHFCPLFETQASCLALSISNNTADTTNNMSKTSNWLSVSF